MITINEKNAYNQLIKMGITNWRDTAEFLIGKEITIIRDISSHKYGKPGSVVKITYPMDPDNFSSSRISTDQRVNLLDNSPCSIGLTEFYINARESKKDIIEDIELKKVELAILEEKLQDLEELGIDEYDVDKIKIHKTINTIDMSLSREEKIQKIKNLINN